MTQVYCTIIQKATAEISHNEEIGLFLCNIKKQTGMFEVVLFFTPQIPSVVSSNSYLKADCNLSMIHKETPLLSRMKDALVPLQHSAFRAMKGRDQLSKCNDVF